MADWPGVLVKTRKMLRAAVNFLPVRSAQNKSLQAIRAQRAKHSLDHELIVSLTSYPPRFGQLHLTLRSLLHQTIRPDRLILWIADEDVASLPPEVLELKVHGLTIETCADLKSYKKLIPALARFPRASILTADDDLYYEPDWLEGFVEAAKISESPTILCRRAHRLITQPDGSLDIYSNRENDVQDASARKPSTDLLFTGCGGVFYPPNSLHALVMEDRLFRRLCPHGDDLWFTWCAGLNGTMIRKIGPRFRILSWPGTAKNGLWEANECGENDRMLRALQEHFGPGLPGASPQGGGS